MDHHKKLSAARLTDDLVVDILSRLTYKSFCRCKCAYRAWCTFSSDPDYRKKLPKKVTTGLLYQGLNKSDTPLVSMCPDDGEIDGILADLPHYEHLEFLDCCIGLVLCKYRSSYTSTGICCFVVCNPATREWRVLPDTICPSMIM
uniref:F-box domain-containing protein n=1 Tax=Hordeum vulgare subsp. vulgare TaxID=112509 RepID=A0A8I6WMK1_HORVV